MTNLVEIELHRHNAKSANRTFDVTAPVITWSGLPDRLLQLGNAQGVAEFNLTCGDPLPVISVGDVVRVTGSLVAAPTDILHADCHTFEVLAHGDPPQPRRITARDFLSGQYDFRLAEIIGKVKDAFPDELDSKYSFLVLQVELGTIYVACRHSASNDFSTAALIGADIAACGMPISAEPINRLHLGRYFLVSSPSCLRIIHPPVADLFQSRNLSEIHALRPQDISALDRHKVFGRVLAILHDGSFFIRTEAGRVVRVQPSDNGAPRTGEVVEAVGFPESNLYYLDLVRAAWRPADKAIPPEDAPEDVTPASIISGTGDCRIVQAQYHGRLIRLTGKVLSLPETGNADGIMRLSCKNHIVPVDIGSLGPSNPNLMRDCTVSVVGICVLDIETWRPNAAFPKIRGFTVVPRTSDDIMILAQPPWWTPQRLFILLCILIPIILGSISLNFILRHLVERRSRALFREQTAKLAESLRVDERTRLAAELHDSVAQDLTGISMQIETAEDLAADAPEKLRRILGTASRSLLNCRTELRNCLWDLRNHALDEQNLGDAIARTLKPHLEGVELALRFNVPRSLVSDATAHATLQIVRELATNAIRHGNAKRLRICGAIERQRLLISVADDGCGFDPDDVPGAAQGHFGLSGIRERIRKLGGTITIQTSPGTGAKATITL